MTDQDPNSPLAPPASPRAKDTAEPRALPQTEIEERRSRSLFSWPPTRTALQVFGVGVLALSVTTFSTYQLLKAPSPGNSSADSAPVAAESSSATLAPNPSVNTLPLPEVPMPDFDEDSERKAPAPRPTPPQINTVHEAALHSCTTESIEALNRQLVEQTRCLEPKALAQIPVRPNLKFGPGVFPYLNTAARDHLLEALKSRPSASMTINSALRTIAQQYLVSRWAEGSRCGVQLALTPGESHHESGLALDVAAPGEWRQTLESHGFHWLGASDRVHFDYQGDRKKAGGKSPTAVALAAQAAGTSSKKSRSDILAFQQLWNRNHPDDRIAASGRYTPETESRLKLAPVRGFENAAGCSAASKKAKP